jgi:hypothetical protein
MYLLWEITGTEAVIVEFGALCLLKASRDKLLWYIGHGTDTPMVRVRLGFQESGEY